jgi:Flp pilus assembly protein TadD
MSMADLRLRLHYISQLIQGGRLGEAETNLRLVRADAGPEILIDGMEGFLLYRRHEFDRAADVLSKAVATPDPPAWWRVVLSMSHFAAGREDQARQVMDTLMKADQRGGIEGVQSMVNAGVLDLRQTPSAAGALAVSFLLQTLGNKRSALLALNDGAKAAPKDVRLQLARAPLLAEFADPQGGLKTIAEALEAVGDRAPLYRAQAILQGRDKKLEDAAVSLRKAVTLEPGDYGTRIQLGAVYQSLGRTVEAITEYEAVAATPDPVASSTGYSALGALLIESKRWKEAEAALQKGMAVNPTRADLVNNLAWLYVDEASEVRNPPRALELALKAVALSESRNAAILDTLAEAYFANGNVAMAIETGRKATALAPTNTSFRDHLARYEKAAPAPK